MAENSSHTGDRTSGAFLVRIQSKHHTLNPLTPGPEPNSAVLAAENHRPIIERTMIKWSGSLF